MKKHIEPKLTMLKNVYNNEILYTYYPHDYHYLDGKPFYLVFEKQKPERLFYMNKESLVIIKRL